MIAVIIAGGSGTRLWPLSTPEYPKHLLSLTDEKSLLQNTLKRVSALAKQDSTIIITEASHSHHVEEQLDLPSENIIVEPARRGSASCVLLAMKHVKQSGLDPDEPIAILWADHLIRDIKGFVATFKRASALAKKHKKVVFIGAEPSYASTGFGYMEHGAQFDGESEVYDLVSFHEKPDHKTAKKYLSSGNYFWNMGYLVTTLNTFEREAEEVSPELWSSYQTLLQAKDADKAYLDLTNVAFEYVFSEKIKDALVIPGNFDWVDIGSYGDLHGISAQDEDGNHIRGQQVELDGVTNSYVRNETDTPVAVIGLDNIVVVNSPNGILVTNKNFAQKVGEISKKFSN